MVKYVYYSENGGQIEAEFDTPNLSHQVNWVAKGYLRALVPDGMVATRNYRILRLNADGLIVDIVPAENPVQRVPGPPTRLEDLRARLPSGTLTLSELQELMSLERGL